MVLRADVPPPVLKVLCLELRSLPVLIIATLKRRILVGRNDNLRISRPYTLGPSVLLLLRKKEHLLAVVLVFVTWAWRAFTPGRPAIIRTWSLPEVLRVTILLAPLASLLPMIMTLTLPRARPCVDLKYLLTHPLIPHVGTTTETPGTISF